MRPTCQPCAPAVARCSAVPVELDAPLPERLPEPVEVAAYHMVSEALTNAAKHAQALVIQVQAHTADGRLHLRVDDDSVGGAEVGRGSGLIGLADRVEALGGNHCDPEPGRSRDVDARAAPDR